MPLTRNQDSCNASVEIFARMGETRPIGGCGMSPTHQWHGFFLCARHAEAYNREYAHNGVDYQPIVADATLDGYTRIHVDVDPVLIAPEHAGRIFDTVCTDCGKAIHRCTVHYGRGCYRQLDILPDSNNRCSLCHDCYTRQLNDSGHRHCNGCRHVMDWLCEDCGSCENCTGAHSRHDDDLCVGCYREREADNDSDNYNNDRETRIIHEYHEYTIPKARPSMDDNGLRNGRPYLWLGVELECEMPSGDKDEAANTLNMTFGEASTEKYIIMADDCSLTNGFETITGPMSLAEHKTLWPRLAPLMAKQGLRSWAHETTGMHVHISKNFHSQLEIGKMLVFLNSPKNDENITKLAGRGNSTYTNRNKKKLTDHYSGQNDGRYNALNTSNENTNEFRIFKGTLKTGHILANIEFCHALAMYVKNASVRVMEDWPLFWKFVLTNRREYAHLIEFFSLEVQQAA